MCRCQCADLARKQVTSHKKTHKGRDPGDLEVRGPNPFSFAAGHVGGNDHLHPLFRDESGHSALDWIDCGDCVHHVCAGHVSPAAGSATAGDGARASAASPSAICCRQLSKASPI